MPVLNVDLLNKIASNENPPILIFDSTLNKGPLIDPLFDAALTQAFRSNTNIDIIKLVNPISTTVVRKISLALEHIAHPVELNLVQLSPEACRELTCGLLNSKVSTLRLTQLSPEACIAVMTGLADLNKISLLELVQLSDQACEIIMSGLSNLAVCALRLNQLSPQSCSQIMNGLMNSQVRMLRLIALSNLACATVAKGLANSKVDALDFIKLSPDACATIANGLLHSNVNIVRLTQLSPNACEVVMKKFSDSRVNILLVLAQLSLEACEEVMNELKSSNVGGLKLVELEDASKVLVLSGLEVSDFRAVKSDQESNQDCFFRSSVASTKRTAENANIAEATHSTKVAKLMTTIEQKPNNSSATNSPAAFSTLFQDLKPNQEHTSESEELII